MKLLVVSLISLLLFAGCKELSEPGFSDVVKTMSPEERETNYRLLASTINEMKENYGDSGSDSTLDSLGSLLHYMLTDSLFPYWYGTPWDFNGVSQTPQQGKIACGYFVSTTLQQCGFQLERVRLAQQASSKIVNTLCDIESKKVFTGNDYNGLKEHIQSQENGLFIIGLDNHVAFISKEQTGIFVIHSSPPHVKRQKLNESSVVTKSNYHVIGNFSHNPSILRKWIKNEAIPTKL